MSPHLDPAETAADDPAAAGRHVPAVSITVCPDGPLLVRGDAALLDVDGRPLPRRRTTVALCRCGRTTLAPYCDGSHKAGPPTAAR